MSKLEKFHRNKGNSQTVYSVQKVTDNTLPLRPEKPLSSAGLVTFKDFITLKNSPKRIKHISKNGETEGESLDNDFPDYP